MSSNREFTEQFGKGITLDSTRIESAVDQLLEMCNEVQPKHAMRRFVETHLVSGYMPQRGTPKQYSWLTSYNGASTAWATLEPPTAADISNPYRIKCGWQAGVVPETPTGELYTWEMSWITAKPTMVKELVVWMVTDATYLNNFLYGITPPTGKVNGNTVDDLTIQLLVDSPLETQDRSKTAVEACTYNFEVTRDKISPLALGAWDTMVPPFPLGYMIGGICVELPALLVLPAGARCRLCVTVPLYTNPGTASGWSQYPWQPQITTANVTLLEPSE